MTYERAHEQSARRQLIRPYLQWKFAWFPRRWAFRFSGKCEVRSLAEARRRLGLSPAPCPPTDSSSCFRPPWCGLAPTAALPYRTRPPYANVCFFWSVAARRHPLIPILAKTRWFTGDAHRRCPTPAPPPLNHMCCVENLYRGLKFQLGSFDSPCTLPAGTFLPCSIRVRS